MTRFSVLGPMECWSGERPVEISGTLQRTLLATLLVGECRPVSVTALVRELWGDTPPPKWENALQAHVSRLRRRLLAIAGHHRPARLIALTSGYTLLVDNSAVDGAVFIRGVALAREMAAREPVAAVNALRTVLSMWRGPAFGLVVCGPMCRAAAQRLDATRLSGLEMLRGLGEHALVTTGQAGDGALDGVRIDRRIGGHAQYRRLPHGGLQEGASSSHCSVLGP